MTPNVRLQNLREFTVQIRDANDRIVGTGIAVSTGGRIVTCAHVVETALGVPPREAQPEAQVGIYFPQVRGVEQKKYCATVDCCFPGHDDDMVVLQLAGGMSPLAPEQIAVLGTADQSEGNPFRTYGYSPVGSYPATRGDGIIEGGVEPPTHRHLQVDPIQLKSRDIAEGMSGAAVLDVNRNLVVGLIAERYYPANGVQDDIGFGVDAKVLTFAPFDFILRGESLDLKPAPELRLDQDLSSQALEFARLAISRRPLAENCSWNNAPAVLQEWTGRDDLLRQITEDWNNPHKHVTGLIGFGGEGKSSLARKWVETLNLQPSNFPAGIFWWGFYENRSADEFLEAALKYLSGGQIDPRQIQSSSLRAQLIGTMLTSGRYLFVLDGIEVMQHQDGDQYGLLQNNDLRDLLTYFARPDNPSFCLITSRVPLFDLMHYTSYTHRDVERLSADDGRTLLRRLGVKGSDAELDKAVANWDGYALTLSILAAYLAERFDGDIKHLADIPVPTAEEPRYERVHRVLRRYDEHLTEQEREFLKLFSVFRLPVQESALKKVFVPLIKNTIPDSQFTDSSIGDTVNRLVAYRIIRHDEREKTYTTHPLIRNHYFAIFTKGDSSQEKAAHEQIKDYYLSIAGDTPEFPTLDDLKPLIEAAHHACQAGAYDEGYRIYREEIDQGQRWMLSRIGAWDTNLSLVTEFFPKGDTRYEPQVTETINKGFIFNDVGLCLMSLGQLRDAGFFYNRGAELAQAENSLEDASQSYQNLSNLNIDIGELDKGREFAQLALDLAHQSGSRKHEDFSLGCQAWIAYLQNDISTAGLTFSQAEVIEKDLFQISYLLGQRGIRHAVYLCRMGQYDYAYRVTEANLEFHEREHRFNQKSQCYRVLGDLDSESGDHSSARTNYESALTLARNVSYRAALIEALLGRGRWQAKCADTLAKVLNLRKDDLIDQAFRDLNEALGYCIESGYRIYEADVRVALAWAYLANGEKEKAKESAQRALQMSRAMGYYWGIQDAAEIAIGRRKHDVEISDPRGDQDAHDTIVAA